MQAFIGQLLLVPYNFAPSGWAFAQGQILAIAQNTALFSLLGTTYGGNGQTTFGLPDLRGRVPLSSGQGPGLSDRSLGEMAGSENVQLLVAEMPSHNHTPISVNGRGLTPSTSPFANALTDSVNDFLPGGTPLNSVMSATSITMNGGSRPHNNMMPFQALNWVIALKGIFPQRP